MIIGFSRVFATNHGTAGVVRTMFITSPTGSNASWAVPSDWNNNANVIHTIGGGAGGATGATANRWGGGGGGGAWSAKYDLTLTPSGSITIRVGVGGAADAAGGDTWFNGTTLAGSSVGAKGGTAGVNTTGGGGAGGASGSGVGDVLRSGGAGGSQTTSGGVVIGCGGGGGAAGPGRGPDGGGQGGNAGRGGNGTSTANGNGAGGGAGAGIGNTAVNGGGNAASSGGNGGVGANGYLGTGAGAAGTTGSKNGGDGTAGTGAGGGGAFDNSGSGSIIENGGNGATSNLWTQSSDSATGGPGGGGGGGGGSFSNTGAGATAVGGAGALYGGGGGGGGLAGPSNTGQAGGAGGQGIIVVKYIPATVSTAYTNTNGKGSRATTKISTTTNLTTSAGDLGSGVAPTEAQMQVLTDGVTNGGDNTKGREWGNANGSADKQILFNFLEGYPVIIDKVKIYWSSTSTNFGSWTIEGSNDNSTWTTLKASFNITSALNGSNEYTFTNTKAYQYYRLHTTNITNGGTGSGFWNEFEFNIQGLY